MNRKLIIPVLLSFAAVLALTVGFLSYRSVFARGTTPTPGAPTQAAPGAGAQGNREVRGLEHDEDLAAALGIDVAALQQARQAAAAEALRQAVAQGLITQEQADAITARGLGGFHFGGRGFGRLGGAIDFNALLAAELNVTVEELTEAQTEAYNASVDRAVTEGTLTQEQADLLKARRALAADTNFQSAMRSSFEAAVQQAVTDGVITQAQADQILAETQGMKFFGPGGFGGKHGGRHGRGGFRGVPGGDAPVPTTPDTAPSVTPGGEA